MKKQNPISFTLPTAASCCDRTAFVRGMGILYMKTKRCYACGSVKSIDCFGINKTEEDGYSALCKKCNNQKSRDYRKTKNGLILNIYQGQIKGSIKRNHPLPKYNKAELKGWILSQHNFNELYNNWVTSGYNKWLKPSVDRMNNENGYCFDNIRLVTWEENDKKEHINELNGTNNKRSKTVLQFDKQGNFIEEYYSISHASRETNTHNGDISCVCKGKQKSAGGFIWKYKNE